MTILKILDYPDPRLKTVAKSVEKIDERIQKIIDDMFETHYNAKNCAALAATQLDIPNPPAITVIDFSPNKDQPLCLINPEIIEKSGEHEEVEGCMSVFPNFIHDKVARAAKIKVRALDREGKTIEFEADDFMAKCIQHELDHLNGKVFLDHLSRLKRQRIDEKITKMKRRLKSQS
jgi:peptide deformylase